MNNFEYEHIKIIDFFIKNYIFIKNIRICTRKNLLNMNRLTLFIIFIIIIIIIIKIIF